MFKSKAEYLATLRKLGESLPAFDTKAKRKAFYETSHLIYNEYIDFGLVHWISYNCDKARGEKADLEEHIRETLASRLAQLKYDGKVPPPYVMKLVSLFDIKRWEIDEHREYCDSSLRRWGALNLEVPPEGFPTWEAEVIAFPSDRTKRRERGVEAAAASSAEATASGAETAQVIAFPARRIVRPEKAVKTA